MEKIEKKKTITVIYIYIKMLIRRNCDHFLLLDFNVPFEN